MVNKMITKWMVKDELMGKKLEVETHYLRALILALRWDKEYPGEIGLYRSGLLARFISDGHTEIVWFKHTLPEGIHLNEQA